jgi:hypothetical protein
MKGKFKNLIANYAFHGCEVKKLGRNQLFVLTLAYLEDELSGWSENSCCPNSFIYVPMTIGMLYKLSSNIYNHQRALLEELKDAVTKTQITDISEKLDEEKEAITKALGDGYYNAKKREVAYVR